LSPSTGMYAGEALAVTGGLSVAKSALPPFNVNVGIPPKVITAGNVEDRVWIGNAWLGVSDGRLQHQE
jgi:hypothetical protein